MVGSNIAQKQLTKLNGTNRFGNFDKVMMVMKTTTTMMMMILMMMMTMVKFLLLTPFGSRSYGPLIFKNANFSCFLDFFVLKWSSDPP